MFETVGTFRISNGHVNGQALGQFQGGLKRVHYEARAEMIAYWLVIHVRGGKTVGVIGSLERRQ
jgi:hypothetical protein